MIQNPFVKAQTPGQCECPYSPCYRNLHGKDQDICNCLDRKAYDIGSTPTIDLSSKLLVFTTGK